MDFGGSKVFWKFVLEASAGTDLLPWRSPCPFPDVIQRLRQLMMTVPVLSTLQAPAGLL